VKNGQKQQNQMQQELVTGGLVEDEDDDVGVVDADVLVALNYEALRKMNCYAHAISPQDVLLDKVQAAMALVFAPSGTPGSANQDKDVLPVHPSLSNLHSHILSSAGRMNHSILDEAATIAQQLGGGGVVFCKSGKDRTAMHVTYKQAQFAARYRDNNNLQAILRDATLIRLHGTRLPICEKNVGQAKYVSEAPESTMPHDAFGPYHSSVGTTLHSASCPSRTVFLILCMFATPFLPCMLWMHFGSSGLQFVASQVHAGCIKAAHEHAGRLLKRW
jgi:hypothetical protein